MWDAFAVSTYATVSLLFWFIGLIPDLATLRDRAKNRAAKIIYGFLAMGWRGSAVHWYRHETASLLLAGLATPLVRFRAHDRELRLRLRHRSRMARDDFSSLLRGGRDLRGICHGADAFDSGAQTFHLEDFITMRHLDNMGKVMLATGLIVGYGYMMEAFIAYYSGNPYERYMILNRMTGPYAVGVLVLDRLQHRDAAIPVVPQSPRRKWARCSPSPWS